MRKIILLILVLSISAITKSQNIEIGIRTGNTFFNTTGKLSYYNVSSNNSFDFGVSFRLPLKNDLLFLQTEINDTKRYSETFLNFSGNSKVYEEFIEIPLLFQIQKNLSDNVKWFLDIGPNISILLKQQFLFTSNINIPSDFTVDNSFGDYYKIGLAGNIGVRWERSENRALTLSLRGVNEFSELLINPKNIEVFAYKAYSINFGYILKF